MHKHHPQGVSWRKFLGGFALAGVTELLGLKPELLAAEPPPETTTLRLVQIPGICQAPQYMAGELLRSEGFTEVQYLKREGGEGIEKALALGEADINMHFAAPIIIRVDAGDPVVILAGGHIGCFELFGTDRVHTISDLKGKTVGVPLVVVNSTLDRPWSHYFCCMVVANRDFVRKYPMATKRALRAILKATDICDREPERAARLLNG